MNNIKTLYKLIEVSSRDLEIPDAYQRKHDILPMKF